MMNPLIIKLGGVLLDSEEALERLFTALVNYRESHQRPLVIVHGGGCVVDELMNVNADQAATALAATLGADLILLSDVSGILDGKGQRIAEMTAAKAEQLIEQGIITDGMIVKVNAALDAARTLGRPVDIASWRHAEQLPALFNGTPIGTRIMA
jgi:acetylglutamate kinase